MGIYDVYVGNEVERYLLGNNGKKILFCIGINPSTADKDISDPTMDILDLFGNSVSCRTSPAFFGLKS